MQVYRVAKALSNAGARMRVAAMTGGQADKKERDKSYRTQVCRPNASMCAHAALSCLHASLHALCAPSGMLPHASVQLQIDEHVLQGGGRRCMKSSCHCLHVLLRAQQPSCVPLSTPAFAVHGTGCPHVWCMQLGRWARV